MQSDPGWHGVIRPLDRTVDRDRVERFAHALLPATRFARYFTGARSDWIARALLTEEPSRRELLALGDDGEIVAVLTVVRRAADIELARQVAEGVRRRSIGSTLVVAAAVIACGARVGGVVAAIAPGNTPALRSYARMFGARPRERDGHLQIDLSVADVLARRSAAMRGAGLVVCGSRAALDVLVAAWPQCKLRAHWDGGPLRAPIAVPHGDIDQLERHAHAQGATLLVLPDELSPPRPADS
jgi:hypothetical protein